MDHAHIRTYFLVIVTTLLGILALYMVRPFIVTVGLAAVFAVIFTPVQRRLEKVMPRSLAAFLTLLISLICVIVPLAFFGSQIIQESHNVYGSISQPGTIEHAQQSLASFGAKLDPTIPVASGYFATLSSHLSSYAQQGVNLGFGFAGVIATWTLSFLIHLVVFLITLFYLLKEGPQLKRGVEKYSPLTEEETALLIKRVVRTISSILRGTLLVALLQGIVVLIGFWLFGLPNSVLWGTIGVLASLVPSLGGAAVIVPGVLYLFFTGHAGSAIGLALFGLIGIAFLDYVVRPYIVSTRSSIHPLLVLLAVFGGVAFFGPAGLFLGPLVMSLLIGFLSIYAPAQKEETKLEKELEK